MWLFVTGFNHPASGEPVLLVPQINIGISCYRYQAAATLYKLLPYLLANAQLEIVFLSCLTFNVRKNVKDDIMRKSIFFLLRLCIPAALAMGTSFATAGSQPEVNWSITIGSPQPVLRVYTPPPVVYVQPEPVYIRPQPVYVRPAAVVQYDGPYYVEEARHRKGKRHHWKHRHHGGRHDY